MDEPVKKARGTYPAPRVVRLASVADADVAFEQLKQHGITAYAVQVDRDQWRDALNRTADQILVSTRFLKDPPTRGEVHALVKQPWTVQKWMQHHHTDGFLSPFCTSVEQYAGSLRGVRRLLGAKEGQHTWPDRLRIQKPRHGKSTFSAERDTAHMEGDEPFVYDASLSRWKINRDPAHPHVSLSGLLMWGRAGDIREFIMWDTDADEDVGDLRTMWQQRQASGSQHANFMPLDTDYLHKRFPGRRTVYEIEMGGVDNPVLVVFCQSNVHEVTREGAPNSFVMTAYVSFQHRDMTERLPTKGRHLHPAHRSMTYAQMTDLSRRLNYHPGIYSSGTAVGNIGRFGFKWLNPLLSAEAVALGKRLDMFPYLLPWDLLPKRANEDDDTIREHARVQAHQPRKRAAPAQRAPVVKTEAASQSIGARVKAFVVDLTLASDDSDSDEELPPVRAVTRLDNDEAGPAPDVDTDSGSEEVYEASTSEEEEEGEAKRAKFAAPPAQITFTVNAQDVIHDAAVVFADPALSSQFGKHPLCAIRLYLDSCAKVADASAALRAWRELVVSRPECENYGAIAQRTTIGELERLRQVVSKHGGDKYGAPPSKNSMPTPAQGVAAALKIFSSPRLRAELSDKQLWAIHAYVDAQGASTDIAAATQAWEDLMELNEELAVYNQFNSVSWNKADVARMMKLASKHAAYGAPASKAKSVDPAKFVAAATMLFTTPAARPGFDMNQLVAIRNYVDTVSSVTPTQAAEKAWTELVSQQSYHFLRDVNLDKSSPKYADMQRAAVEKLMQIALKLAPKAPAKAPQQKQQQAPAAPAVTGNLSDAATKVFSSSEICQEIPFSKLWKFHYIVTKLRGENTAPALAAWNRLLEANEELAQYGTVYHVSDTTDEDARELRRLAATAHTYGRPPIRDHEAYAYADAAYVVFQHERAGGETNFTNEEIASARTHIDNVVRPILGERLSDVDDAYNRMLARDPPLASYLKSTSVSDDARHVDKFMRVAAQLRADDDAF